MSRESALLGLLADLATDRGALIAQRDALKAENEQLRQAQTSAPATPPPDLPAAPV